jgi:hypothetical protein
MRCIFRILSTAAVLFPSLAFGGIEIEADAGVQVTPQLRILGEAGKLEGNQEYKDYLLRIRWCLKNNGPKMVTVVAGVEMTSYIADWSSIIFGVPTVVIHDEVMKPSLAKLQVVDLKPGEAAALPEITVPLSNSMDAPDSIVVMYRVDPEFRRFYDFWTGDMEVRLDMRASKERAAHRR